MWARTNITGYAGSTLVFNGTLFKLKDWVSYARTLSGLENARPSDIFRTDTILDYEEDDSVTKTGTEILTNKTLSQVRLSGNNTNPSFLLNNSYLYAIDGNNSNKGIGYLNNDNGSLKINATEITTASDIRIKYNKKDIFDALKTIEKLKPKSYNKMNTISDSNYDIIDKDINSQYESGFIAQDILNDIPELKHIVIGSEYGADGKPTPLSLNYTGIIPYITGGVQELHKIVKNQETIISSLQTQVSALQKQNLSLESKIAKLEENC